MNARPVDEQPLEPALAESFDITSWSVAELVARSEYLHEEIVKTAIFGCEPLSKQERAKYQPFVDAILEFWSSGDTAGLVATYAGALHAFETLVEQRAAATPPSGDSNERAA